MNPLNLPLILRCGATLPNRLAKAAMTEGLADSKDHATEAHERLYDRWSQSGAGLLVTGNVMVDPRYLERPGNVVVDDRSGFDALERMARAGTRHGNHCWVQINHPGRQCTRMSSAQPVSASDVEMRGMLGLVASPRALTAAEIREVIASFARTAAISREAGFTGVQIHSAHGYLSSQFLSPYTNRRTDEWGGSLENRARFVLETYRAVRRAVGDGFPVAVKLNSSDFQKGGFDLEDSAQVARWLCDEGLDLLEISGGTYEQTALFGQFGQDGPKGHKKAESTKKREAYFLEYAETIRAAASDVALMVTGGFRTVALMKEAVETGAVDVVGLGRPFCVVPDLGLQIVDGTLERLPAPENDRRLGPGLLSPTSPSRGVRTLNSQAEVAWFYRQILRLAAGQDPDPSLGTWPALIAHFTDEAKLTRRRASARRHQALATSS